jgi:2-haloacid dehalogenase
VPIELLTFDCYGTLVDWEGAMRWVFDDLAVRGGWDADFGAWFRVWEPIQFDRIAGPYRPYREVLAVSFAEACRHFGYPFARSDVDEFARVLDLAEPFADTRAALERLKASVRIGIVSNTDRAIIARTLERIGVAFDTVTVAEDAQAYKPSEVVFRFALERAGIDAARCLHAAFGFRYDIVPANRLGIRTCWVRRGGEIDDPPEGEVAPDATVATLAELAERIDELKDLPTPG